MARQPQPNQTANGNMIFGNGDSSYVSGEMLKQVDVPVETLLGTANGALSGALISAVISGAVTAGKHEGRAGMGRAVLQNITGAHGLAMIGGTVALGALGGIVRHSRAMKHNEWSDRHYAHLEHQTTQEKPSFSERETERRVHADKAEVTL